MSSSGIYQILCLRNRKRYIGSAQDLKQRFANHKSALRTGKHHNLHLQRAYDKHGLESLEFEVLVHVPKSELFATEQRYLDEEKPEFNINPNADAPLRGRRHKPETIEKIRATHKRLGTRPPGIPKGSKLRPESIEKMKAACSTPEARARRAEAGRIRWRRHV